MWTNVLIDARSERPSHIRRSIVYCWSHRIQTGWYSVKMHNRITWSTVSYIGCITNTSVNNRTFRRDLWHFWFLPGRLGFQTWYLDTYLSSFSQFRKANAGIISRIISQPLPFTSFPSSWDAIQSKPVVPNLCVMAPWGVYIRRLQTCCSCCTRTLSQQYVWQTYYCFSNVCICGDEQLFIYLQQLLIIMACWIMCSLLSNDSLEAERSGDRMPMGERFSAPVQTVPGSLPASYTMGTGSLPGLQRWGSGVDHPPHLEPSLKKEFSSTSIPLSGPSWPVLGWPLPLRFALKVRSLKVWLLPGGSPRNFLQLWSGCRTVTSYDHRYKLLKALLDKP